MSIEQEVFPPMAKDGQLHAMPLGGFWADVGQPRDFITGTALYLTSLQRKSPERLATGPHITGNVLIDPSAKIGNNCKIGPNVVIGPNVTIGDGVRLNRSVIMKGSTVHEVSKIVYSIIVSQKSSPFIRTHGSGTV